MSALGDYIHRYKENYLKWGINKNGELGANDLTSSLSEQKRIIENKINALPEIDKRVLEELQTRVKMNFPEGKNRGQLALHDKVMETKLGEKLKQKLLDEVPLAAQKIGLGRSSIQNFSIDTNSVGENAVERAKQLRRNLLANISTLNQNFALEKGAGTTPDTILKNLKELFHTVGVAFPEDVGVNLKNQLMNGQNTDCRTALEELVRALSFSEANNATLHGQWGEQTVALCSDTCMNLAEKELNQHIKTAIVGGQGTQFQINESQISSSMASYIKQETGRNIYQLRRTQDKVDVQIIIKDQSLDVSVKAYTAKNGKLSMHLQDVNLLTSLLTTTSNFANHWLNLHVHNISNSNMDKTLADHMKYEALVSGNMLKQGALHANTFVAIDVNTGNSFVTSTKDILLNRNVNANFGNIESKLNSIRFNQKRKFSSSDERIADILIKVHQQSIPIMLFATLNTI